MLFQLRHPTALLGIAVALLVGLYAHDAAQVLVARALGDPAPWRARRLTAPLPRRVDPYGAVAAVIVGYGWGTPVEVDLRWRARRWRSFTALLAGPAAYALLALVGAAVLRALQPDLLSGTGRFLAGLTYTWAALAVVAVLPVPPLDGGRALFAVAPLSPGWSRARYQLEETQVGVVVALVVVLFPLLLGRTFVVGQLAPALLNAWGDVVGLSVGLGDVLRAVLGTAGL